MDGIQNCSKEVGICDRSNLINALVRLQQLLQRSPYVKWDAIQTRSAADQQVTKRGVVAALIQWNRQTMRTMIRFRSFENEQVVSAVIGIDPVKVSRA